MPGHRNYASEYARAKANAEQYGLNPVHVARRRYAPGEVKLSEIRAAEREIKRTGTSTARIEVLQHLAFAKERRFFQDQPMKPLQHGLVVGWNDAEALAKWQQNTSREDLIYTIRDVDRTTWAANASYQYPGNSFWYHYLV